MDELALHLSNFEKIIAARLPYYKSASPIGRATREIYATRCASAVLAHVRSVFSGAAEITFIYSSIYFPDVPESTVDLGSYEEFEKKPGRSAPSCQGELHKGQN